MQVNQTSTSRREFAKWLTAAMASASATAAVPATARSPRRPSGAGRHTSGRRTPRCEAAQRCLSFSSPPFGAARDHDLTGCWAEFWALCERVHHAVHRRVFPVLHLHPMLRSTSLIRPIAMLRDQALQTHAASGAE